MEQRKKHVVLLTLNVISLLATITVNALANVLPLNGRNTGEISDAIPNLFVPAGLTFAIWGPIYLLLVVFVLYQVVIAKKQEMLPDPVELIGPWFFISCIANSMWIIAWHWQQLLASLGIMLLLLVSLIRMYQRTRSSDATLGYRVGIMLPLSVYLGWITVATIANVTSLLVVIDWNRFTLSETTWTLAVIVVAIIINLLAILLKGDMWFALVGVWAIYGIYLKRSALVSGETAPIVLLSMIGMIVIGVAVVIHLIIKGRKVAAGTA